MVMMISICEIMMEEMRKGDSSLPYSTYNLTKDFDWDNPDYDQSGR